MYRFTIRDLLWLTVVVALGAFAWVQRRNAREVTAANERLVAQVEELSERLKNAEWWAGKFHALYGGSGALLSGAMRDELFEQQRQRAQGELAKQLDELNKAAAGDAAPPPPEPTVPPADLEHRRPEEPRH